MLLNFAYGMGVDGSALSYLARAPLFFFAGRSRCVELAEIVKRESPDLIGLVEVDGGSMRAGFKPQWKEVIGSGNYSVLAKSKYLPDSVWGLIPILQMHSNAILCSSVTIGSSHTRCMYFSIGMERLILHKTVGNLDFYLVHLALDRQTRLTQLTELAFLIHEAGSSHKIIVMGDFNAFGGRSEFNNFLESTGFRFGSSSVLPTFPAYKPKMELDNILVSKGIEVVSYKVLPEVISDHRAIIMEIK